MKYKSILLVDDDPDDLVTFIDGIRSVNADAICMTAKNGKEALSLLQDFTPDLIISDINMPVMDGVAFLQCVRKDLQLSVPVVIVSTSSFEKDRVLLLGADYFFAKCNSIKELDAQLKMVLSRQFNKGASL